MINCRIAKAIAFCLVLLSFSLSIMSCCSFVTAATGSSGTPVVSIPFQVGDQVQITGGNFQGLMGEVIAIDPEQDASVEVRLQSEGQGSFWFPPHQLRRISLS